MAALTTVEHFTEDLCCSICLELFLDPVMLECGHNYCQACIGRYWDVIPTDVGEDLPPLTCPECRCEIPGGKFTANRALGQLARKAMETLSAHGSDEDAEPGENGSHEEIQGDVMFCMDDGCLVRVLEADHWGHRCFPLEEAVESYKDLLTAAQTLLESRVQAAKVLQDQSSQKVPEITSITEEVNSIPCIPVPRHACHVTTETSADADSVSSLAINGDKQQTGFRESKTFIFALVKAQRLRLEQHLSAQFIELHQWLQEKEVAMRREIWREEEVLLSQLERNQRQGQEQTRVAEEQMAKIKARLDKQQDPETFLKDIKVFTEKFCPSEEKCLPLPPVSRGFSLGQYKGPVQYMVWRHMLPALRPSPCLITLDPATNHPNLILSKDLASVHLVDTLEEEVLDGPERFSKSVCVLGAQGFTSGRHYWEVEVEEKTSWDIGVAKESVNRKEAKVMLKPSNGFWAIWLRNGSEYKALDSPSRQLSLQVKPQKIGVYLDYEGGQVSFYDGDTMDHICTFSDIFTECLYPMFSPGFNKDGLNGEPLRLLRPWITRAA